jgi:hypothetical protein
MHEGRRGKQDRILGNRPARQESCACTLGDLRIMGKVNKGSSTAQAGNSIDTTIVYAKIHPGIGVARVGNSELPGTDGYYIGQEYPSIHLNFMGQSTRDANGAIKRQAARFRIYGYNAAGVAVRELTPDDAQITWTVTLANRKPQWYVFDAAMDLQANPVSVGRRNPLATGADRDRLALAPVSVSVSGKNDDSGYGRFTSTAFFPPPPGATEQELVVFLGNLKTDDTGRLLVLGGYGRSYSAYNAPMVTTVGSDEQNFNNSPYWVDDTSDGPVEATVVLNGTPIPVTPSWVIVAPPNYAPGLVSVRTLYDVAREAMIEAGRLEADANTSFQKHILPTLFRLSSLQWTNAGFASLFGTDMGVPTHDFSNLTLLGQLSDAPIEGGPDNNQGLRCEIFQMFRPPGSTSIPVNAETMLWPPLYGDTLDSRVPQRGSDLLAVTVELYGHLQNWAEGNFENDYLPATVLRTPTDADYDVSEQPAALDEGPLSYCIADAFHPGCELTWPMRHPTLYSELARIKPRTSPEPDYGDTLTTQNVVDVNGPLYAQVPGGLTRWMALPWQGDSARCRAGYDADISPYLPSFWPARVPNTVLTADQYAVLMDTTQPPNKRIAAYRTRSHWLRNILNNQDGSPASNEQVMENMVNGFQNMGIIQPMPGPTDLSGQIPFQLYVETLPAGMPVHSDAAKAFVVRLDDTSEPADRAEQLRRAGWASEEQLESFKRLL